MLTPTNHLFTQHDCSVSMSSLTNRALYVIELLLSEHILIHKSHFMNNVSILGLPGKTGPMDPHPSALLGMHTSDSIAHRPLH